MKSRRYIAILMALILSSIALTGCGGSAGDSPVGSSSEWKFEKEINEPRVGTAGQAELILGDMATDGVQVKIPAGAFTEPTEVTLVNPESAPGYDKNEMDGLGAPFEITAGDGPVRLMEPVEVTVRYDSSILGEDPEYGSLYFGYFNGNQWEYIKPAVNQEENTMTFLTSHFSLFSKAKLTMDERIDQYVGNAAVADWAKDQANSMTDDALNSAIEHILKDKLKINDSTLTGKILGSLKDDSEWEGMLNSVMDGDPESFNQNLQVLLGKKIVENVSESTLSKALGAITDDAGIEIVAKAGEAAGYLAEGRYKDAAKIIGEQIADQFMITKVGKFAVAAIDSQIQSWKSEEIEAAYQAYKNGASSSVPWWGYQVEKGNFDDVWDQMGGAARQLVIEAIRSQNEAREEAGIPLLTPEEENKLRESVRKDLQKQFERRIQTDTEIEKNKAELEMIMEMYKDSGFMEKGRWGWESGYELEQRLDVLMHFKNKLLKDTKRTSIKEGSMHNEEAISIEQLKTIAMKWFSTPDAKERQKIYEDYIKTEFGIKMTPEISEINGLWSSGQITILEYDLGPVPEQEVEEVDESDLSGCDISSYDIYMSIKEAMDSNMGKPIPIKLELQLGDDGSGTVNIIDDEGEKTPMSASYSDGNLIASLSEEGTNVDFTARISRSGDSIILGGEFNIKLTADAWVKGSWSGTK